MNTLHMLNDSPFETLSLSNALQFIAPKDGLLLMGDAVYALTNKMLQSQLDSSGASIYALEEDICARAIKDTSSINIIDYDTFVKLCTEHKKLVRW